MIIRLCQCSICTLATTVRASASNAARAQMMQHSKDIHKYVPSTCNIALSRYPMTVLRPDSSSARKNGIETIVLITCAVASENPVFQANYINALAVSISSFVEPAGSTLGDFFSSLVDNFFKTLGELFKSGR
jgi:hypothetical protein